MLSPVIDALRSAIVVEARSWIGTPFQWQASVKGAGCDCKGLIAGIARELRLPEADSLYARLANYRPGKVDTKLLKAGLAEMFDPATAPLPGDLLLLRVGGLPQHLAILSEGNPSDGGRMIHTYGKGPARVIEVPMGHAWRSALDSAWSWRERVADVG